MTMGISSAQHCLNTPRVLVRIGFKLSEMSAGKYIYVCILIYSENSRHESPMSTRVHELQFIQHHAPSPPQHCAPNSQHPRGSSCHPHHAMCQCSARPNVDRKRKSRRRDADGGQKRRKIIHDIDDI